IFDPYLSIKYANYHINYLKKHLKDPLLIAYAYNAGIGYTKRALLKKAHFKRGEFEPYLSFELVSKEQARDYGLQVLANYVIYQNILGKRVKLKDLIENFIKNNF
ncbi:MAG: lytic transglycosylase domain-containing protein, partial [Epsilonproteobacteria bacterium]|nr:lytic transglycosylase domain-containing protein [Campylobacterota bacterium]